MHEALVRMHSQILPHLVKPNLLHDFLVDCLDAGGATSLLALNALFSLMTTHNLNYPSFYPRLYALLQSDPPFLHVRYRSRFLRLLDVFLSSTHLPATLVASFVKRLSRVALRAPPAAIVVVIPFVWNLCKRHKRCLGLLHREFGGDRFDLGPAGVDDPFDDVESDPLKTGAIDSSLWELAAMGASLSAVQQASMSVAEKGGEMHYLASVSSLSKILAEPFTKERYDLEDFLDLTYGTLFETEVQKTLKKRDGKKVVEPALVYVLPSRDGKRLPILGARDVQKDKDEDQALTKKRSRLDVEAENEDEDVRNAKLAMKEVHESARKSDDACNRLFAF
jgi:U3 small nucleolar RNA-associated protein 19